MDPSRPTAEAVAWRNGKILAVGVRSEVLEAAGPQAIIETFPNSVIVPGLVDAHAHLASLGQSLSEVSLLAAKSEDGAALRLKGAPESAYQGPWLMGRG